MSETNRSEKSIRLFFESFSAHLAKIRDEPLTANPSQRAHIMLNQLRQFERAFLEMGCPGATSLTQRLNLPRLVRCTHFKELVHWLLEEQQMARLMGLSWQERSGHWVSLHGQVDFPPNEETNWIQKGVVSEYLTDSGLFFCLYAMGAPRIIMGVSQNQAEPPENTRLLAHWVARLLPLFVGELPLQEPPSSLNIPSFIARDPCFLRLLALVDKAARTDVSILLEGESGTGKEMVANFIHNSSPRKGKPLVAVNCAAIPAGLMESELFGHEKGSFTGAYHRQVGRIEEAHGGTLFLDEVGEMELPMQAKLLRFLQLHEFHRVGGKQKISVDVRIVAASNRNLKKHAADGHFREDLFYRLSVMPFTVPPLRARLHDIIPLTHFFVEKYARSFNLPSPAIEPGVLQCLLAYEFPGNVRELENLVQNLLVRSQGQTISVAHLPEHIAGLPPASMPLHPETPNLRRFVARQHTYRHLRLSRRRRGDTPLGLASHPLIHDTPEDNDELKAAKKSVQEYASKMTQALERRFVEHLLNRAGGSMQEAARLGNINRTLLYKMVERTRKSHDEG